MLVIRRTLRVAAAAMAALLLVGVAAPLIRQACAQAHRAAMEATADRSHEVPAHAMPVPPAATHDGAVPACVHADQGPAAMQPSLPPCCFMSMAGDDPGTATVTKPSGVPVPLVVPGVLVAPPAPPAAASSLHAGGEDPPAPPFALHLLYTVFLR